MDSIPHKTYRKFRFWIVVQGIKLHATLLIDHHGIVSRLQENALRFHEVWYPTLIERLLITIFKTNHFNLEKVEALT
ncbi:hypothetical protein PanWU01x14_007660 [Parasponia andersonii]|uniref:Uncharacterized protein n=1 Tax=Parasponia andersonii TaxID=3476 RepID=A0A2P5E448_PARAD|nr:hypothetical protein PanWU01x14_007660 [Parasponia andersonii]